MGRPSAPDVPSYGTQLDDHTQDMPGPAARLGATRLDEWLPDVVGTAPQIPAGRRRRSPVTGQRALPT
jgi:hypothetical protein